MIIINIITHVTIEDGVVADGDNEAEDDNDKHV